MLSLSKPVRFIAGHAVFSDHEKIDQYYIAPQSLEIAALDSGNPDISLLQYTSVAGGTDAHIRDWGGLISLGLQINDVGAVLEEIKTKLEDEGLLVASILPIFFDNGQAKLSLPKLPDDFDSSKSDEPPELLVQLSSAINCVGRLRTSFNTALSGQEAAFLAAAMREDSSPLLVSYALKYTGMRDALRVEVEADWERIYTSTEQKLQANLYYVNADVEKVLKEAFEDTNLKITSTAFSEDATQDLAEAEAMLVDLATQAFFEPEPPSDAGQSSLAEGIADAAQSLLGSMVPGVRFRLKMMSETERKALNLQLDRSQAETRTLILHSTLSEALNRSAMFEHEDARTAFMDNLNSVIPIAERPRLDIPIKLVDRFESDGLHTVLVDIGRPDPDNPESVRDMKTFSFTKPEDGAHYSVVLDNDKLGDALEGLNGPILYRLSAELDPSSTFERRGSIKGDWQKTRARSLTLDPRIDLPYAVNQIEVIPAPGFSFQQYPNVSLELHQFDTSGERHFEARVTATEADNNHSWQTLSLDSSESIEVRQVYMPPFGQGKSVVKDWEILDGKFVMLENPLPAMRPLNVFSQLDFEGLLVATLEIKYEDTDTGFKFQENLDLTSGEPVLSRQYGIMSPEARTLTYRLTVMSTQTGLVVGDWHETDDQNMIITNDHILERNIRFRLLGQPLNDHNLRKIIVETRRTVSNTDSEDSHRIEFIGPEDVHAQWRFAQPLEAERTIEVKTKFVESDGRVDSSSWKQTSRDLIIISASARHVTL